MGKIFQARPWPVTRELIILVHSFSMTFDAIRLIRTKCKVLPWTVINTLATCRIPARKTMTIPLSESRRTLGAEELLRAGARDTVGERELEVLGDELLNVGPLDVLGLLELDDAENLRRELASDGAIRDLSTKNLRGST